MNPVVIVLLLAGALVVVVAAPLIRRKVGRNDWYGVRTQAAFASEQRWLDINERAGRLFRLWGWTIMVVGLGGIPLAKSHWVTYNVVSLIIGLGGLAFIVARIFRAGASPENNQSTTTDAP
ncbi:MAG: SdpI family protein [Lacunisphaera sp.]